MFFLMVQSFNSLIFIYIFYAFSSFLIPHCKLAARAVVYRV